MASRKQRSTTSETYALELDYEKCLAKAKRLHRKDMEFFLYQINNAYCSISSKDYATNEKYRNETTLEHWLFDPERYRWKTR